MKLPSFDSISPLEMIVFIVFLLYLIFPVPTIASFIPYINSNIGICFLFLVTVYMVFYTTPILGILSIFVAYELIRRSSNGLSPKVPIINYTPMQPQKDSHMTQMNPTKETSLEEEIIDKMAPIGSSPISNEYIETKFKPLQDKIENAAMIH